jgi:hypothetical protein
MTTGPQQVNNTVAVQGILCISATQAHAGNIQSEQNKLLEADHGNGWTSERRARQAELIRQWKPWAKSTGPRSPEGRQRLYRAMPGRGGHRQQLRELSKMVNAEVRASRELVSTCTA